MRHDEDKLVEGCRLLFEYLFTVENAWRFIHIPNGGKRNIIEASRFKRMGVRKGVPDVLIILNNGYTCFVEFKDPKGKGRFEDEQLEYRDRLIKSGHYWFSCKSIDEFKKIIDEIRDLIIDR
jgi:hypothetical protein